MKKPGTIARLSLIAILTFFVFTFTGCVKNDDNIVEQTTLDENGYTDYYMNNAERCGYTLYISTGALTSPLSNYIETNVNKISGYGYDYQGIFFNCTADGSQFIAVLVNTRGAYIITKIKNNSFSFYNGSTWTSTIYQFTSASLNLGYNTVNAIKVKVTGTNTYEIYFNGSLASSFTETEITGGLYKGFMFNIDTKYNEGFPDNYFEVKFKEIFAQ